MSDDYQIEIPPSFLSLYVDAGRQKSNATREVIAARYELCEDLANLLTETAKNMFFSLGITERDVLERCHRGLIGEGAVVNEAEAGDSATGRAPGVVEASWVLVLVAEFWRRHIDGIASLRANRWNRPKANDRR
jgi:hypothetical protein